MFDEDLDVFFDLGDFAVEAVFELPSGNRTVRGIFDNAFYSPQLGETVVEGAQPRFTAKFSNLRDIPRGTFAVVNGARYSVVVIMPEGSEGTAVAHLIPENPDGA